MTGIGSTPPVEAVLAAHLRDAREPLGEVLAAEGGRVEQHGTSALTRHRLRDPAGDDVARGELAVRMHVEHEAAPGLVEQHGALAANRLGDEGLPATASAVGWNW